MNDDAISEVRPVPAADENWGTPIWQTFDIIVRGYGAFPDENLRDAARAFFVSWKELLPCPKCRAHFAKLLEERSIEAHLDSAESLQAWVQWARQGVDKVARQESRSATEVRGARRPRARVAVAKRAPVSRAKPRAKPSAKPSAKPRAGPLTAASDARRRLKRAEENYRRPCMC